MQKVGLSTYQSHYPEFKYYFVKEQIPKSLFLFHENRIGKRPCIPFHVNSLRNLVNNLNVDPTFVFLTFLNCIHTWMIFIHRLMEITKLKQLFYTKGSAINLINNQRLWIKRHQIIQLLKSVWFQAKLYELWKHFSIYTCILCEKRKI